ncbi:LuxR C-terminal-related transcriptional regulator [Phytoactinopolyspora endophytica]|uniref:LuxR C-terminal-related transcriptional regulator n=1 Tax=Phytoactinopolyspora endophytica TaxID=1642495 RepID=UPI00101CB544|nr:LuxR C-terminal-related transcriptional regulator [Phytoactinopolyspora endophytica]
MSLLSGVTYALRTSDQMERAQRLSKALSELVPHRVLSMLVSGCEGSPVGTAGEHDVANSITARDLVHLESTLGTSPYWQGNTEVAGETRPVAVIRERGHPPSVLLLVRSDATPFPDDNLSTLAEAWSLFIAATEQSLDGATALDLNASRAAAGERVRVTAELTDCHRIALSGILGTLRARHLDDHAARQTAIDLAATALVELRTSTAVERELGDEPLTEAFERLREELRPVTRFSTAQLEFAAPSGTDVRGVTVPATVGHAARAISRGAVLALLEQADVGRLRVAWALAGGLEISVRDDGPGTGQSSVIDDALTERAQALGGSVKVESVPGWGTNLVARLPFEDATSFDATSSDPLAALRPRELDVLAELVNGRRNREIAEKFSISENTVKYHVANVLAQLGVNTRNQAALIAHDAGIVAEPTLRAV